MWMIGEAGQCSIITHRSHRVTLFMHQRDEHEVQAFPGVTERTQPGYQRGTIQPPHLFCDRKFGKINALLLQPLAIRLPRRKFRLQLKVRYQFAFLKIHQEHTPWLEPPFLTDHGWIYLQYTDFTGHHHAIIGGNEIATGAQAITIQDSPDTTPIGKGHRGGSIPRLHHGRVIFVECPLRCIHRFMLLPRFGNHHHYGCGQGPTRHQQKFQRIIQATGIRAIWLNHREDRSQIVTEQIAVHDAFACLHPVAVTTESIDFPVMRHQSHGVCPIPTGKRIRRKSCMDHRKVADIVRRLKIRKIIH